MGRTNEEARDARRSYRDTVMGDSKYGHDNQEEEDEDGNTSDDDIIEEGDKVM